MIQLLSLFIRPHASLRYVVPLTLLILWGPLCGGLLLLGPLLDNSAGKVYAEQHELLSTKSLAHLESGVRRHTLKNGVRVLFYKRSIAPIFAGIVSIRVGGIDEKPGRTGAAHLFEHLAFKGTPEIGTRDFQREEELLAVVEQIQGKKDTGHPLSESEARQLEKANASLQELWSSEELTNLFRRWGASGMNATTATELTNYFASFPISSFEFWCWIESERLLRPVMRQFYKERDVVLEERRSRYENNPEGKLYAHLLQQAFNQHPYRNPVIGYEQDIRALQPDDVRELYNQFYVGSNIVIGIVGDVDFDTALPVLERYYGRIPAGEPPPRTNVVEPPQNGERLFSVSHDAEPVFMAGYRKPIYPDKREPALSLFLDYALGSRVAPLYKEIVIEKRLATSLGYFEAPGDSYPNLAILYGQPASPYTNREVLRALDEALKRLLAKPVEERKLNIVKRSFMKEALLGLKSNMGLARELVDVEQNFGDWKMLLRWYEAMLQTSPEEVRAAAAELLRPEERTVGFLSRTGGGVHHE